LVDLEKTRAVFPHLNQSRKEVSEVVNTGPRVNNVRGCWSWWSRYWVL